MMPTSKSDSAIDLPDLAATDAFGRKRAADGSQDNASAHNEVHWNRPEFAAGYR